MIVDKFRKLFQRKTAENTEHRAEETMKKKREELDEASKAYSEKVTDLNRLLDEIERKKRG